MIKNLFTERISDMPESIFSVMSKYANEYSAVNLGQGFPDFDGPSWIFDEAYKAMQKGKNQYAPSIGIFSLRNEIKKTYKKHYNLEIDENDVTVTAGATEALFSTIVSLIEKGDEVIMFEPFYDAHQANVVVAGGTPVCVTLRKPDFSFDPDELKNAINKNTKMIIVNNPHNPTGKTYTYEELKIIAELAIENDLLVLSDEVYEFLTYDNIKHIPIATLPGMYERTITISSTGKTFGMTGWKIGYTVACPKISEAIRKIHQWTTFAVNTPAQHAMAFAFSKLDDYLPSFRAQYQAKRDLLYNLLKDSEYNPMLPGGSYFMMADVPKSKNIDDMNCALYLVKDYKIATIPPSVFYLKSDEGKTMLRLCFAKQDETIRAGAENMLKYL
jgi:aspartate/methionine/tyrosine aminotransferase